MDGALGGALSAFEVMWNEFYRLVTTPPAKGAAPISQDHAYYVLIEGAGGDPARDQARFEEALGEAIESDLVADAVIASSESQRASLWALRDDVEQFFRLGMPVVFDISLPVTEMEGYVAEILARLEREWPAYRRFVFGHLGDGNLHVIAEDASRIFAIALPEAFLAPFSVSDVPSSRRSHSARFHLFRSALRW
jgi:FAD/FMN-containing dehydrogenase